MYRNSIGGIWLSFSALEIDGRSEYSRHSEYSGPYEAEIMVHSVASGRVDAWRLD